MYISSVQFYVHTSKHDILRWRGHGIDVEVSGKISAELDARG